MAFAIKLLKNKILIVKTDEFGKQYYHFEDNEAKIVIRYTYYKVKVENLQDSGYREEIIYEINTNASELNPPG